MLCPACGHENLRGADECAECGTSLTQEDTSTGRIRGRIALSLSEDRIEALHPAKAISVGENTTLGEALQSLRDRKWRG